MSESRPVLAIRWPEFDRMCAARGWTTEAEIAEGTGISYQMLRHMRTGYANPGADTIDRILAAFGHQFYPVLIERVPADAPATRDVA
jgi:transcriptional regulator with XRE-family HTH domain